jgi:hypothetical protein
MALVKTTMGGAQAATVPLSLTDLLLVSRGGTSSRKVAFSEVQTLFGTLFDTVGSAAAAQAFAIQRANHTGTQLASTISDFNEAAQDAALSVLADSSEIDWTYNDGGNSASAAILAASIADSKLATMANLTLKGNISGGAAVPAALTPAQVTTNFVVADNSTLEVISNQVRLKDAGTTNTKLAVAAANTIKANATAGSASPTDLALGANTIPGRSSTGNIVAKSVSDAGFNWLTLADIAAQTAALNAATIALKGMMSANDKITVNNIWTDCTTVGILTSNTGAQNVTAFNAWYSTAAFGATLYFPPGLNYDFDAELTLNRDIRIKLMGAGKGRSIIRSTSTTANLFNQTVAGFYIDVEQLGFDATVTKTAGAAILVSNNNATFDIRQCEFKNQFNAVDFTGANSPGNLSILFDCLFNTPAPGGRQIRFDGPNINAMVQNVTVNVTGVNQVGIEIKRCGALQFGNCDLIGGTNTVKIDATGIVSAAFFTNCFLDQATLGSTLKIMGTFAASRIKFIGCGITNGAAGFHAVEIAGTGVGTGIPEAIDFMDCDVYNNSFGGTTYGFLITGVRGFTVRNSRIAGFTDGFNISPYSANGITNFDISGNTIGPTENFSGNGTGIRINAGAFQYGTYSITDNDLTGNTTAPLVDLGAVAATGAPKRIRNNIGLLLEPASVAGVAPLLATQTLLSAPYVQFPNALRIGSVLSGRVTIHKTGATVSTVSLTIKQGTTNAHATDATVATLTLSAGTLAVGVGVFTWEVVIVTATTAICTIRYQQPSTTGVSASAAQMGVSGASVPVAITNINALAYWGVYVNVATVANIQAHAAFDQLQQ